MNNPAPAAPLSYPLGAKDISNIVDAILPKLSPFFPKSTKDEVYVLFTKAVLALSKGKTFSNKDELDIIVKDIVKQIVDVIVNRLNLLAKASDTASLPLASSPDASGGVGGTASTSGGVGGTASTPGDSFTSGPEINSDSTIDVTASAVVSGGLGATAPGVVSGNNAPGVVSGGPEINDVSGGAEIDASASALQSAPNGGNDSGATITGRVGVGYPGGE